jgi:hypothetical protein
VPPNLLANIHVSPDEEHAMTATNTFSACKPGYADTRFGTVEEGTLANLRHNIAEMDSNTSFTNNTSKGSFIASPGAVFCLVMGFAESEEDV